MKTYTKNIAKLYESTGFERLEKGKTYNTSKGGKLTISDIYIDATQEVAEAYISYNFESSDGQKINEVNRYNVAVDILRNK